MTRPVTLSLRQAAVIAAATGQIAVAACAPGEMGVEDSVAAGVKANRQAEWTPLFDGRTLTGWRGYRSHVATGWHVVEKEAVLTKDGPADDLISVREFGDHELAFDWKLSAGGNSGAFVRATEEYDYVFWSAPEYQLLDDASHADGKDRLTSAGSAFALYPAPAGAVRAAGEWNSSVIVATGDRVQHWLNGQKLLEYDLGSLEWQAKVKASKFAPYRNFGRAKKGHIGFQGDHEGTLSLRNIRIREL